MSLLLCVGLVAGVWAEGSDLVPAPQPLPDKPLEAVPPAPFVEPPALPKDQDAVPKTDPTPAPLKKPGTDAKSARLRRDMNLDQLFLALKAAASKEEGEAIENDIETRWLLSGSDTVDLLMSRALKAMAAGQHALSLDLLDMIVMLKPDYAEAWNRRATVHYARKDFGHAISDVERALRLEPRQFNAMTGLANLLEAIGDKKGALAVHRQILDLHPTNANSRKEVDTMTPEIEGRPS